MMIKFRFLIILTGILLLLHNPSVGQQASQNQSTDHHTVTQGETLFSISRDYNITVSELREWNSLSSDNLQTGQRLRVTPPAGENRVTHRSEERRVGKESE